MRFAAPLCPLLFPLALAAQAPTCGWAGGDPDAIPDPVATLLARDAIAAEAAAEVVAQLHAWYRDCDDTAARRAVLALRNATQRARSDLLLRALYGMALVRGVEVQIPHAEGVHIRPTYQFSNSERDGTRLLADVVRREAWIEVGEELAAVALATRNESTLKLAAGALSDAAGRDPTGTLWQALADVQLARGELDDARRAATRAQALGRGGAARTLAITGILDGQPGSAYLAALESAGSDVLPRFLEDLRPLLSPAELAEADALPAGERAQWLRQRWEWRALLAGVPVEERVAEHHRRVAKAFEWYPRTSYRLARPWTSVLREDFDSPLPFDDRGLIYIRHGEPDEVLRMRGFRATRRAWVYHRLGNGRALFEFDKAGGYGDYFLAEPIYSCSPMARPQDEARVPVPGDMLDWAMSVSQGDPSLGMLYFGCFNGSDAARDRYAEITRRVRVAARTAFRTETAVPRLDRPLQALFNAYAFRAEGGTELVGVVAVDGGALAFDRFPPGARYRLATGLAVGDPASERVASRDTVATLALAEPLPAGSLVRLAVSVRAPPADSALLRFWLRNEADREQGQVVAASRDIPHLDGTALQLSDLVLSGIQGAVFRRGAHVLAPLPGHQLGVDQTFRLFYELYGAAPDDELEVELTALPGREESLLARLRSLVQQRTALSLTFRERAAPDADGVLRSTRDVRAELEPGSYVLSLRVRNERTGEVAERETELLVLAPGD